MSLSSDAFEDQDIFIADILSKNKIIAMVGASKNWKRPSNFVMKYLQKHGFTVIPINPGNAGQFILNELCYASLQEVPIKIDMVNIFRPSEFCASITKDAINIGAKTVWMQLGIKNEEAINLAKEALKDLIAVRGRQVSVENIQKTVAEYFKIKISDMLSKKRSRNYSKPRQLAMALTRELTNLSFPEIGEAYGGRHHTTVMHACEEIEQLRLSNQSIAQDLGILKQVLKG